MTNLQVEGLFPSSPILSMNDSLSRVTVSPWIQFEGEEDFNARLQSVPGSFLGNDFFWKSPSFILGAVVEIPLVQSASVLAGVEIGKVPLGHGAEGGRCLGCRTLLAT